MISHIHKAVFIHVPKTAGMSMRTYFRKKKFEPAEYHSPDGTNDDQTGVYINGTSWRIQRNYTDVWDRYFKFAFVRNPWERCVSQYIWRIKKGGNFVNGPGNVKNGFSHPNFNQKFVRNNVTFRQFLEKDFPWQEMSFEQHMRPQVEFIYDCTKTKLDFIIFIFHVRF